MNTSLACIVTFVTIVSAAAAERLERGAVAVPRPDGSVFISWRLLVSDPPNAAFNVYRTDAGQRRKLNQRPVSDSCNFVDRQAGGKLAAYVVEEAVSAKA